MSRPGGRLRSDLRVERRSDADVHLVGGPGPGQGSVPLRLLRSDRTFPDGSVELVYEPGPAAIA